MRGRQPIAHARPKVPRSSTLGPYVPTPTPEQRMAAIYADGTPGAWWEPGDTTTLFQDAAGTTPVTTLGQPVGLMRDKSGRGNHLFQNTTASRPTWQQDAQGFYYLRFDGIDDGLATASATWAAQQMLACFSFISTSTKFGAAFELSGTPDSVTGSFNMFVAGNGTGITANIRGTSTQNDGLFDTSGIGTKNVLSASWDFAQTTNAAQKLVRINGADKVNPTPQKVAESVNFAAAPIFIGRRNNASDPLDLSFYGGNLVGKLASTDEKATVENYRNSRIGAY